MQSYQIANDDQIKAIHASQRFYIVEDKSYNRMMTTLKGGAAFVKSYPHKCSHTRKEDCKCVFYKNYLNKDGFMVRNCGGSIKPVISISALIRLKRYLEQKEKEGEDE